jgi:PEP-CTERM motif
MYTPKIIYLISKKEQMLSHFSLSNSSTRAISICIAFAYLGASQGHAEAVHGQGTWEATLQARNLDENPETIEAYYDTELDITWTAYVSAPGSMPLEMIKTYTSDSTIWGVTGWRLPVILDTGAPGCDYATTGGTDCGYNVQTKSGGVVYSELAHMYQVTLGNKPAFDESGNERPQWGLTNTGPFENIKYGSYYSRTPYLETGNLWQFGFGTGYQGNGMQPGGSFAWLVHSGNVGAALVPEPNSKALMLFGLCAFWVARRRRKTDWPV